MSFLSMTNDTPRTEEVVISEYRANVTGCCAHIQLVPAELSRQLERELGLALRHNEQLRTELAALWVAAADYDKLAAAASLLRVECRSQLAIGSYEKLSALARLDEILRPKMAVEPEAIPGTVEYDDETEWLQKATVAMRNQPLVSPTSREREQGP